jgi:NADPH2:quinone reductase
VRVYEHGGPEVLVLENVDVGHPGPGELRIHIDAIGIDPRQCFARASIP